MLVIEISIKFSNISYLFIGQESPPMNLWLLWIYYTTGDSVSYTDSDLEMVTGKVLKHVEGLQIKKYQNFKFN